VIGSFALSQPLWLCVLPLMMMVGKLAHLDKSSMSFKCRRSIAVDGLPSGRTKQFFKIKLKRAIYSYY
jgi:hypothetical protein